MIVDLVIVLLSFELVISIDIDENYLLTKICISLFRIS